MSITSTLVQRAHIRFVEAVEPLRSFVGCFFVMEVERDVRRFTSASTLVGTQLRPGVAFLVTGIPTDTIVDRRIALDVAPAPPPTPDRCIDVLQQFLLQRLANAKLHDVLSAARDLIEREHGNVRAAEVAAYCGVSARYLHRLMRTWIGYGPKVYATVIRFQATLHEMENTPRRPAADLASQNGYFDQAHLTLDVARFAGATPGRLASTGVADFSKTRCDDFP